MNVYQVPVHMYLLVHVQCRYMYVYYMNSGTLSTSSYTAELGLWTQSINNLKHDMNLKQSTTQINNLIAAVFLIISN